MKSYWIKRIVRLLVLLLGVSVLCFVLTALSSTDPAVYIIRRGNLSPTPEMIAQVRAELGLDQPLPVRYFNWIGGIFHGDFGESVFSTNEVAEDLARYFPQTLQLVVLSLAEIIVFSILLGVLCAAKKNKLTDHIMRIISLFGICVPPFWLGFLLLLGFAVEIPIFSVTPAPGIVGLILPSITLSFPVICSTVRVFRASLLEEMHRDYVSYLDLDRLIANSSMTQEQRLVINLLMQGWTETDIAETRGCSRQAVCRLLRTASRRSWTPTTQNGKVSPESG